MILNPAIIALTAGSFLVSGFACYASAVGVGIIRWWDIRSGSERQLELERKTYLVSTILACLLGFELFSLFLFVYTADHIHGLFTGAMCAAGSLNVNDYGYPTLVLKILNFILCGIWIVVNHADSRGFDYPLIRTKYKFLLLITALICLETVLQAGYFTRLKTDVITSCCGTLFSDSARSIAGEMAALPPYAAQVSLFFGMALLLRIGVHFFITGRAAGIYSLVAGWLTILSVASVISFISLYYYELPTHHCPFCLLQSEYRYIGYPLYLSLFAGGIAGTSMGVIGRLGGHSSLERVIPEMQRKLCLFSMLAFIVFLVVAAYPMVFSDFVLEDRISLGVKIRGSGFF